jgi:type VI secretion system secreted protein Hcp
MSPRVSGHSRSLLFLLVAASLCFLAVPARAANDLFLRITTLTGESAATGHVGDIDLLSFSWGASNSGTKGNAQDLNVTKRTDKTSPPLMLAVFTGTHYSTVTLFVRNQGANPLDFFKITLTDVTISSYQVSSASANDGMFENISLHFATVKLDYQPQNPDGTANGGTISYGFNITTNAKI